MKGSEIYNPISETDKDNIVIYRSEDGVTNIDIYS